MRNACERNPFSVRLTAWKVLKYGVFYGPYSVRVQENTDQKKLRIWTLVTLLSSPQVFFQGFPYPLWYNLLLDIFSDNFRKSKYCETIMLLFRNEGIICLHKLFIYCQRRIRDLVKKLIWSLLQTLWTPLRCLTSCLIFLNFTAELIFSVCLWGSSAFPCQISQKFLFVLTFGIV